MYFLPNILAKNDVTFVRNSSSSHSESNETKSIVDSLQVEIDTLKKNIAEINTEVQNEKLRAAELDMAVETKEKEKQKLNNEISHLGKLVFKMQKVVAINLCSQKRIKSNESIEINDTCITLGKINGTIEFLVFILKSLNNLFIVCFIRYQKMLYI